MALNNTWNDSNEIYNVSKKQVDQKEKVTIYRDSSGFEAFVVGETETAWLIDDNNGVRCKVKKSTTKNSLYKVNFDYQLKRIQRH